MSHAVETTTPPEGQPLASASPPMLLLALVCLALLATFHQHFLWLWNKGWHNEYYGHGLLIPLISAFLIYRRRHELAALPRHAYWPGLLFLTAGLALHILAITRDVNFVQGFGLVSIIAGLTLWLYGWRVGVALLFPLCFLLFMVPMGRLLVDALAQPMQLISAKMAGAAAAFAGIPAVVQGTSIKLPDYTFEVAIPCSGLKSAIAMTALGALYAHVLQGAFWQRLAVFAMSLPAALLANGMRIWLTLVLARSFGNGAADGFFHTVSGMFVFVIALAALFGFGSLIGCNKIRDDI